MNLKQRFSFTFSILFSILVGVVLYTIFTLFANFRKDEFRSRLEEKGETTIKLLTDVKEIDYQLLKTIDRNSINKLYNEKVLVFDDKLKLIYSSIDDAVLKWTTEELVYLQKHDDFFHARDQYDVFFLGRSQSSWMIALRFS